MSNLDLMKQGIVEAGKYDDTALKLGIWVTILGDMTPDGEFAYTFAQHQVERLNKALGIK